MYKRRNPSCNCKPIRFLSLYTSLPPLQVVVLARPVGGRRAQRRQCLRSNRPLPLLLASKSAASAPPCAAPCAPVTRPLLPTPQPGQGASSPYAWPWAPARPRALPVDLPVGAARECGVRLGPSGVSRLGHVRALLLQGFSRGRCGSPDGYALPTRWRVWGNLRPDTGGRCGWRVNSD
jgi:hypothetical protein